MDGNDSFLSVSQTTPNESFSIPTHVSDRYDPSTNPVFRRKYLRTIKRTPEPKKGFPLPVVLCVNPRSLYGRENEFSDIVNEYEGDLICISESWNRPEFPLSELLKTENFENFKVFMNVKQRKERGGKPAVLVNTRKYHILELCPKLFTVPSSVEAVWILLKSKIKGIDTKIAVCSYYFSKNITLKEDLYEHIISSYNLIKAKYGENIHMILCADSNRLDLSPILDLSEHLSQVVKVPTRLNPDAILDTIITTLSLQYESPITKPPIGNDSEKGKPSDHLIVIWRPLTRYLSGPPKRYRSYSKVKRMSVKSQSSSQPINVMWTNLMELAHSGFAGET